MNDNAFRTEYKENRGETRELSDAKIFLERREKR